MKSYKKQDVFKGLYACICMIFLLYSSISLPVFAETKYNTIPIAMAADNNYVYPTLVSMTSVLENAGPNTKYNFYLMVPSNFTNENKNIIKSLKKKYKRCSINIIDMGNAFKDAKNDARITTSAYYRLSLSELLPNIDKIIWLDGDTIVFKDLTKMINLNMKDYYYRGFLDYAYDTVHDFGIRNDHYICSGVMLINLKALRENNIYKKFLGFIDKNNHKLSQHDQTVINVMCCDKVGILPPEFGMFNFANESEVIKYNDKADSQKYVINDLLKAYKDPTILHYAGGGKPWVNKQGYKASAWWYYAGKTGYLNNIKEKYLLIDGKYMIQSALNENKVLDISNGSKQSGANLQLWEKSNSPAQRFFVKYNKEDGCYSIKNEGSGKNVDVKLASKANGANIQQYYENNTDAQKWRLIKDGDYYRLQSKCNGLFMDVDNAKTQNETNIRCWENNGTDAQKFKFLRVA